MASSPCSPLRVSVVTLFRPRPKDADPRERAIWGDLMSLGLIFPIAIALGFFGGRWIGGWFGHPAVGQWIGLAYGVATGFWELYKVTQKLDRMDRQNQEKQNREKQDPPEDPKDQS